MKTVGIDNNKVMVNYNMMFSKMNDIANTAKIINVTANDAYSSTTKIPSLEPQIINNMFENYSKTIQKIITEAESTRNIIYTYRDLETDLSSMVNELGMEVKSKPESITPYDDIITTHDNEIDINIVLKELEEKHGIKSANNNQSTNYETAFNENEYNNNNEIQETTPNDENNNWL